MKTKAAVLFSQPGKWEVTEVDLDEPEAQRGPRQDVAAGLCHSDDHMVTGDMPAMKLPIAGGHEGAGIVEAVGSACHQRGARRPRRAAVHPRLRTLPLVRQRPAEPLRLRRHAPGRLPARRHLPDAQGRHRRRADGAWSRPSRSTPSCPAISCVKIPDDIPFDGGLPRRLRRPHRLGLGGRSGAEVRAGRRGHHHGHRRHRHQLRPGRQARRRLPDHRRRPRRPSSGRRPCSSAPPTPWRPSSRPPSWPRRSPTGRAPTAPSSPSASSGASTSARRSTPSARAARSPSSASARSAT